MAAWRGGFATRSRLEWAKRVQNNTEWEVKAMEAAATIATAYHDFLKPRARDLGRCCCEWRSLSFSALLQLCAAVRLRLLVATTASSTPLRWLRLTWRFCFELTRRAQLGRGFWFSRFLCSAGSLCSWLWSTFSQEWVAKHVGLFSYHACPTASCKQYSGGAVVLGCEQCS